MESAVLYYGIRSAVLWNLLCCIMESAGYIHIMESALLYFGSQFSGYVNNYVRNCSGQMLSPIGRNLKQCAISTS